MALRPTDFKSVASTNSATGACVSTRKYAIVRARILTSAARIPALRGQESQREREGIAIERCGLRFSQRFELRQ